MVRLPLSPLLFDTWSNFSAQVSAVCRVSVTFCIGSKRNKLAAACGGLFFVTALKYFIESCKLRGNTAVYDVHMVPAPPDKQLANPTPPEPLLSGSSACPTTERALFSQCKSKAKAFWESGTDRWWKERMSDGKITSNVYPLQHRQRGTGGVKEGFEKQRGTPYSQRLAPTQKQY